MQLYFYLERILRICEIVSWQTRMLGHCVPAWHPFLLEYTEWVSFINLILILLLYKAYGLFIISSLRWQMYLFLTLFCIVWTGVIEVRQTLCSLTISWQVSSTLSLIINLSWSVWKSETENVHRFNICVHMYIWSQWRIQHFFNGTNFISTFTPSIFHFSLFLSFPTPSLHLFPSMPLFPSVPALYSLGFGAESPVNGALGYQSYKLVHLATNLWLSSL